MNRDGLLRISLTAALASHLLACSTPVVGADASTSDAAVVDTGRASTRGIVRGTVTYGGTNTGRLTVGVWTTPSPMGPPTEFFAMDGPNFPLDYELTGLPVGTYYLGAVLDVGANNPTLPGAEDPQAFPMTAIVIVGGDTHDVDVTLADPTPAP